MIKKQPYKCDHEQVLNLLKLHGYWALAGYDGCLCSHINLADISIDVHCHKSYCPEHEYSGIHVECNSPPSDDRCCEEIAKEVQKQLNEDRETPIPYSLKERDKPQE